MSTVYNTFRKKLFTPGVNLETLDIRAALIQDPAASGNDPEAAGEEENDFLGDFFASVGISGSEFDGANYVRTALTNKAVTEDAAIDKAVFDADDYTINSLGAGTNGIGGVLLFVHVTDDTDSWPICYIPFSAVKTPDGSNFAVEFSADGIIRV